MAVDIIARGLAGRADSKAITAYEYAKRAGYTGTEQEFAEDMGNSATNATNARESAEQAQEYAEQAEQTLENKADIDGSYEDLTAGSAEQLLSSVYVEDNTPYSFRTSGGNLEIGNREEQRKIIGASVVQNQLINPNSSQSSGTTDGVTVTNNKDGSYTISGTKTSNANTYYYLMYSLPVGSKYVICGANTANAGGGGASGGYNLFCAYLGANSSFAKQQGQQPLIINPSDTTKDGFRLQLQIGYASGAIHTYNETIKPMVINLTHRFGAEFADWLYSLTRAKYTEILYRLIPELNGGFISYNKGVLESVNVSKHRMTQYNQWDEEWELGTYNTSTGQKQNSTTQIRSVNKIRILPNTSYYIIIPYSSYVSSFAVACYYDINGNFISTTNIRSKNDTIVSPNNAYYMTFFISSLYGKTYSNDICISFYYDGERAGEYEPFKSHEYEYDSSVELRGILKVDENGNIYTDGDEYNADGSVKRKFGVVDLGTLTWEYVEGYNTFRSRDITNAMLHSYNVLENLICSAGYVPCGKMSLETPNLSITLNSAYHTQNTLFIKDTQYGTNATAFKSAMSGKILVYELATPTEETANPFTETQVVDNWGTEEFVDAQGRSIVLPVGQVTDYLQDLKAKLETAPNAPSENGDYLVRQSNSGTEYVHYTGDARIDNLEESKADKNGHYEEMTVGNAEQLLSNNYLEDNTAYNFRKTAGGKAVGDREIDEIIGGTLVINQLIDHENAVLRSEASYDSNTHRFTVNVAENAEANNYVRFPELPLVVGHKYFLRFKVVAISEGASFRCYFPFSSSATTVTSVVNDRVFEYQEGFNNYLYVGKTSIVTQAQSITFEVTLVDITQMFGSSTIADYIFNLGQTNGLAWLYEYFPILNGGYIPYNTGTMQSIVLSKHKLPQFNQWDEEWEVGSIDNRGQPVSASSGIRSKNYIRVCPNTQYFLATPITAIVYFYDINNNFISLALGGATLSAYDFTTPSNCYYIKFRTASTYGTTYNNDICINFSGDRNGEYEPYTVHEYTLDSSKELRGFPQIDSNGKLYFKGDRYKDNVTRIFALIDMGTLNWRIDDEDEGLFYAVLNSAKYKGDCISVSYICVNVSSYVSINDMQLSILNSPEQPILFLRDISKAQMTPEQFKTAMTGKMLQFELAVSTTENASQVPNPQICSPYGTEEYIDPRVEVGTIPFAIPTGHNTQYLQNLRQKLDDLPFAPTGNGDYLVRVSSDGIAFIPFANGTQIPTIPTTDGTYDLVANVSSGTVTLSWVARS